MRILYVSPLSINQNENWKDYFFSFLFFKKGFLCVKNYFAMSYRPTQDIFCFCSCFLLVHIIKVYVWYIHLLIWLARHLMHHLWMVIDHKGNLLLLILAYKTLLRVSIVDLQRGMQWKIDKIKFRCIAHQIYTQSCIFCSQDHS